MDRCPLRTASAKKTDSDRSGQLSMQALDPVAFRALYHVMMLLEAAYVLQGWSFGRLRSTKSSLCYPMETNNSVLHGSFVHIQTGPQFKGVKMIPAGLHFAHYGTGEGEKQVRHLR